VEISKVILQSGKEKSIQRQHPWVFSGAIKAFEGDVKNGDFVAVLSHKGKTLGFGHYQNGSIAVRILSFDPSESIDQLFKNRIESAYSLRKSLGHITNETNTIFRLIHGEGDYLSGLIVDYYDGNVVVQCHSIGMFLAIDKIKEALIRVLGKDLHSIYLKCTGTLPKDYEGYTGDAYIYGKAETPLIALENNNKFAINWVTGQKTGFFIDQRENRALLGRYSKGKKILNTFCYSGGFSIYALNAGAKLVHSLDASQKAIDLTEENIALANVKEGRHLSIVADAMDYMKELPEDYDIIILDPPAFAKHRKAKHNAVQGYKRLNAHAIRQIKPGGIIFTFSCSQVIDKLLFTNTIIAAAISANRKVRILEQLHQPADHPISSTHPEGEYLKGLVIQVE
jgi:23S rRNA (cytosine1962-C5)-methyltransferase